MASGFVSWLVLFHVSYEYVGNAHICHRSEAAVVLELRKMCERIEIFSPDDNPVKVEGNDDTTIRVSNLKRYCVLRLTVED